MKKNQGYVLIFICFFSLKSFSQQVAINEDGSGPNLNAILDLKSPNKGLLIPRMSTGTRLSIPATRGLLVFDTTANSFWYNTGSGWQNLAVAGTGSTGWSLTGNSGTTDSTFIGTTDHRPFIIRVNNRHSGRIEPQNANTIFGYRSNNGDNGGDRGSFNTITGFQCMLINQNASHNTANGAFALRAMQLGAGNTAVGASAMQNNVAGDFNVGVGFSALITPQSGDRNTAIGAFADIASFGPTNATAIGHGAFADRSNKVRIGDPSVTIIEGQVPFTTPSDGRFKSGIQEDVKGLDFILRLRPVTYHFNAKQFDETLRNGQQTGNRPPDNEVSRAAYKEAAALRRTGFIAQEVASAAKASDYNFSGIISPKNEGDYFSLSYESFVVPLVKAVQELNAEVTRLKNELNRLKQQSR
jgi:trimeric autotransporter adhesin